GLRPGGSGDSDEEEDDDEERGRSRTRRGSNRLTMTPSEPTSPTSAQLHTAGTTPKGGIGSALAGLGIPGFGIVKALTNS
nr:hypothetical protein [Tanacetum cinerariifolium]